MERVGGCTCTVGDYTAEFKLSVKSKGKDTAKLSFYIYLY